MTIPPNLLAMVRERVRAGAYEPGGYLFAHGAEQGFTLRDALRVIHEGIVIENYPERRRCLIAARIRARSGRQLWLHVVCDYNDRVKVGITTAYVPDLAEWGDPPIRREPREEVDHDP